MGITLYTSPWLTSSPAAHTAKAVHTHICRTYIAYVAAALLSETGTGLTGIIAVNVVGLTLHILIRRAVFIVAGIHSAGGLEIFVGVIIPSPLVLYAAGQKIPFGGAVLL